MKRLSVESFGRAQGFLETHARPLDRALFAHRFAGAPAGVVAAELAHFRNPDGGFGRALEPDVRTPSSSALATGIGLSVLRELGAPADDALVRGAVDYLCDSLDPAALVWRVVPQDANDHPHAPWWHDEDGGLARTFDDYLVIPRAQLVGLLHHYRALVPPDWLELVTEATVAAIETIDVELLGGGGDGLVYALSLAETEELPQRYRERLVDRLRTAALQIVCGDPARWDSYCAPPVKLAPSPASMIGDLLTEQVERHLDYLIERQSPDGAWEPTWSWGDAFPSAWETARQEWRGHLTLETLTSLRAYGRIEGLGEC